MLIIQNSEWGGAAFLPADKDLAFPSLHFTGNELKGFLKEDLPYLSRYRNALTRAGCGYEFNLLKILSRYQTTLQM